MDDRQLNDALAFALEAAREAGELTLKYFRSGVAVETKSDETPVTIADRSAEELLRKRIEHAFPDHGVLGEEFGEQPGREATRWIIDPIDGTFSFICGVPLYSNLIGLEHRGEMVLGVIHLPALGETVFAARGLGCYLNDRDTPARVSSVCRLKDARLSATSVKTIKRYGRYDAYCRLRDACKADRGWADAYAYALLATGRVDVVLDPIMSIWDTAALLPVVTEAGGTLTDWSGRPTHTAPEALGTNGHLLNAVLELVAGDADDAARGL
ncbi:MAG: histidinol-phosphatase [Planctomycetota bacterium]|nr:MAG: histidinol-phosphatase [Planctomycetota bacterium]